MLTKEDIKRRLTERGYSRAPTSWENADEYDLGSCYFYILTVKRTHTVVVVDRPTYEFLATLKLSGVILGEERKSADFRKFKEKNASRSYIGFFVNFEALPAFDSFIAALTGEEEDTLSSDIEAITNSSSLTATQKQTLVYARVGQGSFRAGLVDVWDGKCAVTGVSVRELLRASHVKPWAASTDMERLDHDNGLLLIANLDAAFDKHLISFTDEGKMLLSDALGPKGHTILGVPANARLRKPLTEKQKIYLRDHRTNLR